jgi:hypothetical protein
METQQRELTKTLTDLRARHSSLQVAKAGYIVRRAVLTQQ